MVPLSPNLRTMPKRIFTERCLLVPIQENDSHHIEKLYSDEKTRFYLGGTISPASFSQHFSKMLDSSTDYYWLIYFGHNDDAEFVGMISIGQHHNGNDFEISYQLLPSFWGKGIAQEAAVSVLSYAKNTLGLNRVLAETQLANDASRKLLQKIGMLEFERVSRFGNEQIIYSIEYNPK